MLSNSRIAFVVMTLALSVSTAIAAPVATPVQIDSARNKALAWLIVNQKADGSWRDAPGGEVVATSSALQALRGVGIIKSYPYSKGVAWLSNADVASTDSLARKIVTLFAAGVDTSPYAKQLLAWKNSPVQATWGAYDHLGTSFPDTTQAISALRLSGYIYPGQQAELERSVFCHILWTQSTISGGWGYMVRPEAGVSDPSSTAMLPTAEALKELVAIRATHNASVPPNWDDGAASHCVESKLVFNNATGVFDTYVPRSLTQSINGATGSILFMKNTDGGFRGAGGAGPSTVLTTALAASALNSVQPPGTVNVSTSITSPTLSAVVDYFISVSPPAVNGSWGGSALQTALVLALLPLPSTPLVDTDNDGIPDAVETLLGTNALVFDSRYLAN